MGVVSLVALADAHHHETTFLSVLRNGGRDEHLKRLDVPPGTGPIADVRRSIAFRDALSSEADEDVET